MRRISTGVQGRPILGNFVADTNTFTTRETNQDIVLNPDGNGIISAESHIRIDGSHALIFRDSDNNNTITIESPSISSDYTLTLPTGTGSAGDVLTVDGSGNLSFTDLTIEVSNQSADTSTYYPLLSTSNSGSISSVDTSSSKLSFQPSSGTLTVNNLNGNLSSNSVDINGGSIDGTTIGSNNAATGTFSSITETSSIALKENIVPIENALDSVTALAGVSYNRIATGRRESGLIAEDVEKIVPELVSTTGDYKSISYSRLTVYLIEAVKDLKTKLERQTNG